MATTEASTQRSNRRAASVFADHLRTRSAQGFDAAVRVPAGTRNFEIDSTVGGDVKMAYLPIADEGGIDWRIAA